VLQCVVAVHLVFAVATKDMAQCTATTHCNTLQHSATHCNVLQHTATHFAVATKDMAFRTDSCKQNPTNQSKKKINTKIY